MATLIVGGVLLAVVALAARSIWKQRKKGGCGGNCSGCPHSCSCHRQ